MTQQTSRRVALVTGGSRGIGAAIALRLARDGHAVAINYASSSAAAEALAAQIRQAGGQAAALRADVSDPPRPTPCSKRPKPRWAGGRAGQQRRRAAPLAQTSDEQYEQMFNINTRGTFNMLRAAATRLADDGRVINLSSTTIALNLPGYAAYIGSKAAVEGFTRVFAKELRGRRVTVNAVAPRPVATELFMTGKSAELIEHYARLPPLERLGQPDDIAGVVAFLAGPDGGWVNGQVLRANGGVA